MTSGKLMLRDGKKSEEAFQEEQVATLSFWRMKGLFWWLEELTKTRSSRSMLKWFSSTAIRPQSKKLLFGSSTSEKAFFFQNLATVVMAFQRDSRKLKDHTEILMQTVVPRNYEDSSIDELCKSTIELILSVGAGNLTFQAKADIKLILAYAIKMVENEENLLEIEGEVKLYGDIHGYLDGLMKLWDAFGSPLPGSKNQDIHPFNYIFLGDFVDRGPNSLETICLLVCRKVLKPKRVYLVRGTHEEDLDFFNTPEDNFRNLKETDNTLYNQFMEFFDRLPMAAVINQRVNKSKI